MGAALPFFKAVAAFLASGSFVATVVKTVLINVALGAISKLLTKQPRQNVPPINVTIRNPVENRRIVFGTVRCGGVIVFHGTSGENNKYLWYVVAFAGHQVSAIKDVWLDTQRISNTAINSGNPGGGDVTAGFFNGKVSIWKHLGTHNQSADSNLDAAFSEWTSDHKLLGTAYIVVRMERDDEVFPAGAPVDVTALIDGALCYDPRENDHDPDDPSTWEFTRNPALHVRHYLSGGSVTNSDSTRRIKYGLAEPDERIDDDYTIAAANICDEMLTGDNETPHGADTRYRCDGEFSTGETRRDILEDLLASMAGTVVRVKGKWRIYAGAYDQPVHALDSADLYGALEIEDTYDHQRRYNAVAAVYRDARKEYVEQTTIYRTDSAYETQDGGRRLPLEIDLRCVTNGYQAQRLAEIKLRKSRMMRSVRMVGALNLLKVAQYETLTFTHARLGWSNRVFRCVERQFDFNEEAGRVALTCEREDASVYTDLETADYETGTSVTDALGTETPDPPSSLTTKPLIDGVLVQWVRSPFPGVRYSLERSSNDDMSGAVVVYEGADNQATIDLSGDSTTYYFRVRATIHGQYSEYDPPDGTNGVPGAAVPPAAPEFRANASPGSVGKTDKTGTMTNLTAGPCTVTPINGVAPFTYAWTFASGGTGITIDAPMSASTTFTATGLSLDETRWGLAKCTVTDDTSDTAEVTVAVTISRFSPFS